MYHKRGSSLFEFHFLFAVAKKANLVHEGPKRKCTGIIAV
jgi:hypothetical protein